jgi:5-bromo-4-chloroindolyl phosphate hydrolysis protein
LASQKEEGVQNAIELSRMKQKLASQRVEYEELLKSYGLTKDDYFNSERKLEEARNEIITLSSNLNLNSFFLYLPELQSIIIRKRV